jgi:catechol 2,3-dioxygenase-like lactoylglutathione lyase family enzyme
MAKPKNFAHIVYMTRRFDEMVSWYRDVFEATVVYQNPALAFVAYDDEHHRFAFANLDALRPSSGPTDRDDRGEIGVNHVAYTYASAGELLQTYKRLKIAGVEPYWPIHHGMTLSLYYKDPDGNRIELQVDSLSVEEANRFMASEAFARNPLGIIVDPDTLLEQFERGIDEQVLLRLPEGPPSPLLQAHGLT